MMNLTSKSRKSRLNYFKATLCAVFFLAALLMYGQLSVLASDKVSWTADMVAAYRAIAALDSDENVRNPDYLASRFVRPEFKTKFPAFDPGFEGARKVVQESPAYFYVNARTHHIDTILKQEAVNGVKQVIILGAGYDSRAYRFRDAFPRLRFFEVDLPAMSLQKKLRVKEIFGHLPENVVHIPLDFNTQSLKAALIEAGYTPKKKSLFIWEGVTYFISPEGVGSTLKFIAKHASPGSSVVFDYMLLPVIEGDYRYYGSRRIATAVARRGEPYIFGIREGGAEHFVRSKGLTSNSDLGPKDLTQAYLIRRDGSVDGRMAEFLRIMQARVQEMN